MANFTENLRCHPGLRLRERWKIFSILECREAFFHFIVDGEAPGLRFRKDQLAIYENVELAAHARRDRDVFIKTGFQ